MSGIPSPCVRKCCLNVDNVCLGCFRSIDEILQWSQASDAHKQGIVSLAQSRRAAHQREFGLGKTTDPNQF